MELKNFEVDTVALKQGNLIEASAGTGKTYSIAILTLRLILEQNILIQEILMVTFTKPAVAELETRVRSFVRIAHLASLGKKVDDVTIAEIVKQAIAKIGLLETEFRLKSALLFLDETSVLTIHSFCQRTLTEYAFETNQIFGAETLDETSMNELKLDEVNHFWRKNIVTLEKVILKALIPNFLSRDALDSTIKDALNGKILISLETPGMDFLSEDNQKKIVADLESKYIIIKESRKLAAASIESNKASLIAGLNKNLNAVKKFSGVLDSMDDLLNTIWANSNVNYVQKIFKDALEIMEPIIDAESTINNILSVFSNKLFQFAIQKIGSEIQKQKEQRSFLTFEDMIGKLHEAAVIQKNQHLLDAIKLKFRAVFIDEFQDTDKKQYEIFSTLFTSPTIVFYIGDPKQSIYGWRKADINTYFRASEAVDNRYGMNSNYRSTVAMVGAQNAFFLPKEDFDTFHYDGAEHAIHYTTVEAQKEKEVGNLLIGGNPAVPIVVMDADKNDEIYEAVTATVIQLLSDSNYQIQDKNVTRRVQPSDIGILVRSNSKGKIIRENLSKCKIPAITIDDTRITSTTEAKEILYLLQAVVDINTSSLNKALLTEMTGLSISELKLRNEELVLEQFKEYQLAWNKDGVYVMLMRFITDYRIKKRLLDINSVNGDRRISNILQLLEVLHKVQFRNHYSPVELINWLQRAVEGQFVEGDEFEQCIESDEDAVKIVTIHKSKGLEYNIVIAPFLDMLSDVGTAASFRDEATGDYYFGPTTIFNAEQVAAAKKQLEQENRRLIYVAITRAKYQCIVNSSLYYKKSSLKTFLDVIKTSNPAGIQWQNAPQRLFGFRYQPAQKTFPIEYKKAIGFKLSQKYWRKISYSYLTTEHTPTAKFTSGEVTDAYSDFIFHKLKKGAFTGNLLHYIFEFINFANPSLWKKVIATALQRLSPSNQNVYEAGLLELLDHVTQCTLQCNNKRFSLSEVNTESRLNEFEFDFVVTPFHAEQINKLATVQYPFHVKSFDNLEGLMNGKMDLFFEKDGKYYILDWKSNFLGDRLSDYDDINVRQAMAENNYHLQYHIYAVAICKYLALRLPDFNYDEHFGGVIYLFVRGVRKGNNSGIFFCKPELDTISKLTDCLGKGI